MRGNPVSSEVVNSILLLLPLLLQAPPERADLELTRMPRLTGKADVQLWRSLQRSPTVFGSRRPVFVRARDAGARETLRALGVNVPATSSSSVDLPQPFLPTMPNDSPRATSNEILSTATLAGYLFVTSQTLIIE